MNGQVEYDRLVDENTKDYHTSVTRLDEGNVSSDSNTEEEGLPNDTPIMARLIIKLKTTCTSKVGLMYAAVSGLLFGITTAICKFLSVTFFMDPIELAFYRFNGCVLLSAIQTLYNRRNIWKFAIEFPENLQQDNMIWKFLNFFFKNCSTEMKIRVILVVRGILVAPAITLTFDSVRFIPLSEATVLLFSSAFLTTLLGKYLLNEEFPLRKCFSFIFATIGVILISVKDEISPEKNPNENQVRGCLEALGGAALVSLVYILTRCTKGVHESVQVFNYAFVAAFALGVFAFCSRMPWTLPPLDWYILAFVAMIISGFCGQLLVTRAMRYHPSGEVSLTRSLCDLGVSFLFQICLFLRMPDAYSLTGGAFMVFAIFLLTFW